MTHNEMILQYMREHGSITPREALNHCGSMRLAARIHELREMGYTIHMELETVKTRSGRKERVARYSLNE